LFPQKNRQLFVNAVYLSVYFSHICACRFVVSRREEIVKLLGFPMRIVCIDQGWLGCACMCTCAPRGVHVCLVVYWHCGCGGFKRCLCICAEPVVSAVFGKPTPSVEVILMVTFASFLISFVEAFNGCLDGGWRWWGVCVDFCV